MKTQTTLEALDTWLRDVVSWILFRTGVGWLTPYVGVVDFSDLDQLRGQSRCDLTFLDVVRIDIATTDQSALAKIDEVRIGLADLLGDAVGRPERKPQFAVVRWPWHASRGWAEYGALRLGLYACLPRSAWRAALFELGNMKSLLLQETVEAWSARHLELLTSLELNPSPNTPYDIQALWHEINFARDKRRRRVVKQTTIVQITWAILLATTIALTVAIAEIRPEGAPAVWLVVVFGALGGTFSAVRGLDFLALKPRSPVETEAVRLRLRPVLGGTVALVAYVLAALGLVSVAGTDTNFPLRIVVADKQRLFWAYCIVGFMAGFSERWFLAFLDKGVGSGPSGDPTTPKTSTGSDTSISALGPAKQQAPAQSSGSPPTSPTSAAPVGSQTAEKAP